MFNYLGASYNHLREVRVLLFKKKFKGAKKPKKVEKTLLYQDY